MGYAIMRIQKHKTSSSIVAAERHATQRDRLKHREHIERTKDNLFYRKHKDLTLLQAFNKETENMKLRANGVRMLEIVLTCSPENGKDIEEQLTKWINTNMNWAAANFGGKENIIFSHTDLDETTINQHIMLIPVYNGKLNCRHYTGDKFKLSALQSSYAKEMEQFNLDRGKCYLDLENAKDKPRHNTLKEYYRRIEAEKRKQLALKNVKISIENINK